MNKPLMAVPLTTSLRVKEVCLVLCIIKAVNSVIMVPLMAGAVNDCYKFSSTPLIKLDR